MTRRLFWQLWGFYMIRISTCWPGPCLRFVFPGFYTLSSWGAHTLLLLLKLSIKQYQGLQTLNGKLIAGKNVSFHLLPHMSRPCRRLRQGNWSKGYKTGCVYTKWARTQNFSWFSGSRARGAWGKRSSIKRKEKSRKQWSEEKKERESERCSWQYSANGDSAQPQHATRCARETCFSVRDNTKEIQLIAQRCNSSLNLYLSKNGIRWTTMRFVKLLWQVFYGIAW